MPSITRKIEHGSDLEKFILSEIRSRVRESQRKLGTKYSKYAEAEDKAIAYMPEREVDAVRRADRASGIPEYTTIQIPYSYAVLMAAHTYLTSVFMGRSPIFQFTGRHGESEQSVQALEALTDYQMLVGRILVPLNIWLHDALKYGIGVTSVYWEDRIESITDISEQQQVDELTGMPIGGPVKLQRTQSFRSYSGNRVLNVQPQDFLWDTRYPAWNFQAGEYCATRFSLNWNEIIRRERQGYYMNTENLKNTGYSPDAFNTADSSALERAEDRNEGPIYEISERKPDHPSMIRGFEVHVEIIPKEWNLGSSDYPEKWVFTATSDFNVLIGAQPLGAWHCKYPFSVLSLEPEGYGLNTRGLPEILEPVQQTVDWLINSHFYNVRAAMNNMFIVDPSKVVMKDLLKPNPGKLIRLKPTAYGTDVRLAVHQFQTQDVTQNHLRDLQLMLGIGERTVGINDQIMGMLNAGGRKTATEVRTSTSFGVNRLKSISEFFSASGFDSMAQLLIANSQQYYDTPTKFKIAGELAGNAKKVVMVAPEDVAGSYDFVPVDGTLPIDRYQQMNMWTQMMGQIRQFPELAMGYDWGKIFEYVAQIGGLKNISQFRIQVAPDALLAAQAGAGNSVAIKGGGAKPTPPGATSPEPGQIPGMGATG